jgi:hypothetical protein
MRRREFIAGLGGNVTGIGWTVCRFHGARSGAPKGSRNEG